MKKLTSATITATVAAGLLLTPQTMDHVMAEEETVAEQEDCVDLPNDAAPAETAEPRNGLFTEEGRITFYEEGRPVKNAWKRVDGKDYYFGSDGSAVKGLARIGSEHYYFHEKTGVQMKGLWKTIGDDTYYFNAYGPACKGLRRIGTRIYYFDPATGVQLKGGWMRVGGHTYYFSKYGPAYTGLRKISGVFYGFSPDGAQYKGGRYTIGHKTYSFNSFGVLVDGEEA